MNKLTYLALAMVLLIIGAPQVYAVESTAAGTNTDNLPLTEPQLGSIVPIVTETGYISLSVDGLGSNAASGIIQVEKPSAGATVRKAYMAAASRGFSGRVLANGDVKIDGTGVVWSLTTPSSISSSNSWADVTSIVKSKIDAAPAGRVDFTITEVSTTGIDGEILAVIFDDPAQTSSNTVILLFGAQNVLGDTFNIGLANPLDKSDPNLVLDMSLGIGFGYQTSSVNNQFSTVDVNSVRMTSSAGGQDDGAGANGALLTAGGLDDSNVNPDPYAAPANARTDDELYDLLPFVKDGDTAITVFTKNPSNDDNIFFAALNLASTTAVVGEGILLSPVFDINPVGTQHTVTAKVQDDNGNAIVGRDVTFTITAGPHVGQTATVATDANGEATFTYTGTTLGTDTIQAQMQDSSGTTVNSNPVKKKWVSSDPNTEIPEFPSIAIPVLSIIGLMAIMGRRKVE